jgi:hypothetical protein
MNLPMLLSLIIFTIIAGGGITNLGYPGPFLLLSAVVGSIGAGLLTTFKVSTAHPAWIGFQVVYGAGMGLGVQLALIIVQAALAAEDIPIATPVMIFAQTLGGTIFVSVSQNIFSNMLAENLVLAAPNVSTSLVLSTGATQLRNVVDKSLLPGVLVAYNDALTRTWFVSVATLAFSIVGVIAIDWSISVKAKPTEADATGEAKATGVAEI